MSEIKTYGQYAKELFNLAMPMILGNLGIILIGAGDVFVAAKYSTNALASISIANSIISTIFLFGIGLLASISPLLSNFRGERSGAKKYFIPTIGFAMIISVISTILILLCIPAINYLGFDKTLIPDIKKYMLICAFSTFGGYLQVALKEYLQAFEIVIFPNVLNLIGVIFHLLLDFIFVFGLFNFPAMGVIGLAIATILSRTLLGIILLIYCVVLIRIRKYKDSTYYLNLIKVGFPIAIAIFLEVAAFNAVTIFVGRISGVYAAAQNILLTISTATFMIPMAISNAIAVKVGFANGAGNIVDLKKYSIAGIAISMGFMALCAFFFITTPKFFITIFTNDLNLLNICVPILFLVGIFQIFDGLQVSLGGVFKGLKMTNIVMIGDFLAYWAIGLPLGIVLGLKYKMNLYGFWFGLTIAILTLAVLLTIKLISHFKQIKRAG